jgi:hypothetical protein
MPQITQAVYSLGSCRGFASAGRVFNSCTSQNEGNDLRCFIPFLPRAQAIALAESLQQPTKNCDPLVYESITKPTVTPNYRSLINPNFTINDCQTLSLGAGAGTFNTLFMVSGDTLINRGVLTGRQYDTTYLKPGSTLINYGTISNIALDNTSEQGGIIKNYGDLSTADITNAIIT